MVRDEGREAKGDEGSGPLWVTMNINGLGLALKEGCGWITNRVGSPF